MLIDPIGSSTGSASTSAIAGGSIGLGGLAAGSERAGVALAGKSAGVVGLALAAFQLTGGLFSLVDGCGG